MNEILEMMRKYGISWVVRYIVWFYVVVLIWWGVESAFQDGLVIFFEGDLRVCGVLAAILTFLHGVGKYMSSNLFQNS